MFSNKDRKYFKSNDISLQTVKEQLLNYKNNFPKAKLEKAATIGDGILKVDSDTVNKYIEEYNFKMNDYSIHKMIPASGAASRMFQQLYEFKETYNGSQEDFLKLNTNQEPGSMYYFFHNLHLLPFYKELRDNLMLRGYYIEQLLEKCEYNFIIDEIISEDGLKYGDMPKGLIKFHSHLEAAVTPMEEHLVEAAHYCKNRKGNAYLNYTVSEDHLKTFKRYLKENRKKYENKYDTKFKVSFSVQKKSTDSIAIDLHNNVIRDEKGLPLLRQSGHGALIENLNDIKANIVYIKNIDNVLPDRLKPETYRYKKFIGGLLISLKEQTNEYLKTLSRNRNLPKEKLEKILTFCTEKLSIKHPESIDKLSIQELEEYLFNTLNRPMRVCGMVINLGEPGGGPFWIKNKEGKHTLQIVEKAQIDTKNKKQKNILDNSTHFNPVDIVCSITDYKNKKFNLLEFVDKTTGFITEKNHNGKKIKGQELPGLWNGAMANWITVFVEVPIETFSPVKTIQDLFKIEHRNILY